MTTATSPTTLCLHPDPTEQPTPVNAARYKAMRRALLRVIPKHKDGVPFRDLRDATVEHLPDDVFAGASFGWYVTTVKLDLEARGLIERVPKASPQRLRRVTPR